MILLNSFKQQSDLHSPLAFCINAIMKYSSRKKFFSPHISLLTLCLKNSTQATLDVKSLGIHLLC